MLQVFSGLIFLCHVNFSSPPAFHTHSQYDLPPWSHSIVFSSNFLPLPLHSSLTLSKFSPFCSTFCFEPWLFPEEPSTDTLPHFPAILRSFEYLLRRRKSPLFSDLLRFLFYFFLTKRGHGWRWGSTCSLFRVPVARLIIPITIFPSRSDVAASLGRSEAAGTGRWCGMPEDAAGCGMRDARGPGVALPRGAARGRQRPIPPRPARSPRAPQGSPRHRPGNTLWLPLSRDSSAARSLSVRLAACPSVPGRVSHSTSAGWCLRPFF